MKGGLYSSTFGCQEMTFFKHKIAPNGARGLTNMRGRLEKTFAKMENRWENLLQEAWEKNETVVFTELEELV